MNSMNNTALIELAKTMADNKFILGDRLVEIGISAPNLEAALASIAMAQAELGHARLLYKWDHELQGLNGNKAEMKRQTGKAFSSILTISNWLSLLAGVHAVNAAVHLVVKAIINAGRPDLHLPFTKILHEQEEHLLYSENWCKQLLNDKGAVPIFFAKELEKVNFEVLQWLKKVENDPLLISENIISENSNLVNEYKENMINADIRHVSA